MTTNLFCRIGGSKFNKNILLLTQPALVQALNQLGCLNCGKTITYGALKLHQLQHQRQKHIHASLATPSDPKLHWNPDKLSTVAKIKWDMGFRNLQVPDRNLRQSGLNLYVCCTDFIDFQHFLQETGIPDTFISWWLTLQLHMWLTCVKLSQMGPEGFLLLQHFYSYMWADVEQRLRNIKDLDSSQRKKEVNNLYGSHFMHLLYYDEGIISSDKMLANAVWLMFFNKDSKVSSEKVALMVEYIRKNVHHHDRLDPFPLMKTGYISFLPLTGERLDRAKAEADLNVLMLNEKGIST